MTIKPRPGAVPLAEAFARLVDGPVRFRITAYDGSTAGPPDADLGLDLRTERGAAYLVTAPGVLGLARAYVAGDLALIGVHPADPYPLLRLLYDELLTRRPALRDVAQLASAVGLAPLVPPPPPPPQEASQDWRRALRGWRHARSRDSEAIQHHYDVSNRFYEMVLGPSMTYTCACYPDEQSSLEEAQAHKYDLVARKLGLAEEMRLLDVGCGWGGMAMHAAQEYGVRVIGVTLSREQATWAQHEIKRRRLDHLAEVRHLDYRDVTESGFDAISSIGLTEHIGVRQYPSYFGFLRSRLRPGGRLLNHCITRRENRHTPRTRAGFIDRYVFPDGELTGSGTIITAMQDAGIEVRHAENLREHYARTCAAWCHNLAENWDACVAEAGEPTAKVWGLYMAGSRLGFETDQIELHQMLGVRLHADGRSKYPLRHTFGV